MCNVLAILIKLLHFFIFRDTLRVCKCVTLTKKEKIFGKRKQSAENLEGRKIETDIKLKIRIKKFILVRETHVPFIFETPLRN